MASAILSNFAPEPSPPPLPHAFARFDGNGGLFLLLPCPPPPSVRSLVRHVFCPSLPCCPVAGAASLSRCVFHLSSPPPAAFRHIVRLHFEPSSGIICARMRPQHFILLSPLARICFLPPCVDPPTTLPVARSKHFLGCTLVPFPAALSFGSSVCIYVHSSVWVCTLLQMHTTHTIAIAEYQAS